MGEKGGREGGRLMKGDVQIGWDGGRTKRENRTDFHLVFSFAGVRRARCQGRRLDSDRGSMTLLSLDLDAQGSRKTRRKRDAVEVDKNR